MCPYAYVCMSACVCVCVCVMCDKQTCSVVEGPSHVCSCIIVTTHALVQPLSDQHGLPLHTIVPTKHFTSNTLGYQWLCCLLRRISLLSLHRIDTLCMCATQYIHTYIRHTLLLNVTIPVHVHIPSHMHMHTHLHTL